MSEYTEDIEKLVSCTCLKNNNDMEIEDLLDADLRDPTCPVHGPGVSVIQE